MALVLLCATVDDGDLFLFVDDATIADALLINQKS